MAVWCLVGTSGRGRIWLDNNYPVLLLILLYYSLGQLEELISFSSSPLLLELLGPTFLYCKTLTLYAAGVEQSPSSRMSVIQPIPSSHYSPLVNATGALPPTQHVLRTASFPRPSEYWMDSDLTSWIIWLQVPYVHRIFIFFSTVPQSFFYFYRQVCRSLEACRSVVLRSYMYVCMPVFTCMQTLCMYVVYMFFVLFCF